MTDRDGSGPTGVGSADDGGARDRLLAATHAELAEHGRAAVSLRAVARRAGVSHAAPQYHFGDRAGLLTAAAADGYRGLTRVLRGSRQEGGPAALDRLGQAYVAYGCEHPALFDLMFRPSELRSDDPELRLAKQQALGELRAAVAAADPSASPEVVAERTLSSWGFVHGLVVLALAGALSDAAGALGLDADPGSTDGAGAPGKTDGAPEGNPSPSAAAALAGRLVGSFSPTPAVG